MQTFKKKITVDLKNTLQRMLATILIPDYLAFKNATLWNWPLSLAKMYGWTYGSVRMPYVQPY